MHKLTFAALLAGIFLEALTKDLSLPTCYRDPRLSRARRLEGIKVEILQRLGLEKEPCNPRNVSEIKDPEFLKKYALVKESWEVKDVQKPPCASLDFRTMEVLPFRPVSVKKMPRSTRVAENAECPNNVAVDFNRKYKMKFPIDLRDKYAISDAQLRLKKSRFIASNGNGVTEDQVDLTFIMDLEDDLNYGEPYRRFVTSERLGADSKSEILTFNVSKALEWWLDFSTGNKTGDITFEIHIRCSRTLQNGALYTPNFQFFTESDKDARLVITTYQRKDVPGGNGRKKRSAPSRGVTFCNPNQIECCLNELEIDFKRDFNWTWILRPKRIEFNYCSGECPLRWGHSTRHSQLLEEFRSRVQKNPAAAAEPCCVPNTYLSVTLAIFLNGVHRLDLLEDIVATSCACR